MPKNKNETLCVEDLRHAEYYEMQNTFDDLYAKSKNGDIFTHLMDIILSRENILLAYRNIKANAGSKTAGTDGTIIKDIGKLPAETVVKKVRYIVAGTPHGYRPKPVRRKEIPKPNGKTRPLGIPCMWDRLIQQCIKQVLEPICEAKFSENSYGFRPNRSVENAIKATYNRLQISQLHYVIEFDIKGFFDNVNHSKLIKQIWTMGIRDKHLIFILKRILKAPIKMPDGTITYPEKGCKWQVKVQRFWPLEVQYSLFIFLGMFSCVPTGSSFRPSGSHHSGASAGPMPPSPSLCHQTTPASPQSLC